MSDKEILDKYIDLDEQCLTDEEKKPVMDMLYKYKHAFSLRNEICTCPNIEVEVDVMQCNFHFSLDHIMLPRNIKRRFFSLL